MDKKERKDLTNLKFLLRNDHEDRIFESIFQSLFLAVIFGLFVMLLWNALLPDLFKFQEINYLQAVGLVVLARLIFGGIAFRYDHKRSKRSHKNLGKLIGLEKISDMTDWKYYDRYWDEEGKQNFEEYKRKIKDKKNRDEQQ
jgi:hypothetical protein